MNKLFKNISISIFIVISMMFNNVTMYAYAEESVESVREHCDELALNVANVGESLTDTRYALEQTRQDIKQINDEIENTQQELEDARAVLSGRMRSQYCSGRRAFVDMLVDCATFEELQNFVYYADKMTETDAGIIEGIEANEARLRDCKNELELREKKQVELIAQQEQKQAEFDKAYEQKETYVNSIDTKVLNEIAEQRIVETEADKEVVANAITAQHETVQKDEQKNETVPTNEEDKRSTNVIQNDETKKNENKKDEQQVKTEPVDTAVVIDESKNDVEDVRVEHVVEQQDEAKQEAVSSDVVTNNDSNTNSGSTDVHSLILEAAYSQLGVPYVYGGESPGQALDCSGFTQYCYEQAGIELPHSASAQAGMATNCDLGELQAGDLVFWEGTAGGSASGNHVAIYLGDGQVIHANGTEVAVGTLSGTWTSCGSIS